MANLSISPEVIREAKEVDIKASSFCEGKLCDETQRIRNEQWNQQNTALIAEYNALIEKEGLALEEHRTSDGAFRYLRGPWKVSGLSTLSDGCAERFR